MGLLLRDSPSRVLAQAVARTSNVEIEHEPTPPNFQTLQGHQTAGEWSCCCPVVIPAQQIAQVTVFTASLKKLVAYS